VPVGDWEEKQGYSYLKMIDVGRKVVIHGKLGFLASQTASYLMNFHLSQRQMWITRHGESTDNVLGKIGGDANLSPSGVQYAQDLANFLKHQRELFREKQIKQHRAVADSDPAYRGDTTPPNPEYTDRQAEDSEGIPLEKNFCVWTSMLRRAIETGEFFNPDEFDVKEMRMLDELNAGRMEGMTYAEIEKVYPQEFALRQSDKLRYRYPGLGGESYLDVINRVRPVIHEIERMTEHICVVSHRVVCRVLLGYFMGLGRDEVATLNVPLGHLFVIEPKPYGVDFRVYKHDPETRWFDLVPDFDFHGMKLK
jgi:6-phosphofructo-2-kinase